MTDMVPLPYFYFVPMPAKHARQFLGDILNVTFTPTTDFITMISLSRELNTFPTKSRALEQESLPTMI